ncbi:hypothetical protein JTE90_024127 [Oedothorax gibbosus]|uniref:Secreted protein n=1 Tax=Oedothorax gibbosus TaxID=931172 RepID=A0AAV6TNC8_9ARAC|nr:hypothetical protein JTE90_024127 [Oedothorax gibbosus]
MLHRAGLCGVLLCWVVFVLSVSGRVEISQYEAIYDCLHKHVCDCNFEQRYQTCFYKLPEAVTVIDGIEKLAHQKFPEIENIQQSLDTVWSVLCREPKDVFLPFYAEAYGNLKVYKNNQSRNAEISEEQRTREAFQFHDARLCMDPVVLRCKATGPDSC